jgi:hypothetical protein
MRAIVDRFVDRVNAAGIPWCHWKSNEHVGAGLDADTDLDLLFPASRQMEVEAILEESGFVRFRTPPHRTYPHIVDFLGLAEETGQLVHPQCHFALTLGEEQLKSYVLPWADEVLDRRVGWEEDTRVWTADPADELVLLLVRGALKLRWRDRWRYRGGGRFGDADFQREYAWLKARVPTGRFVERAEALLGRPIAARLRSVYEHAPHLAAMASAGRDLQRRARAAGWRRMSAPRARLTRWSREAANLIADRVLGGRVLRRRVPVSGGAIVAILGIDGSGKSSVTERICRDWRAKLDIERIYFGVGDGPKSLVFGAATGVARRWRARRSGTAATGLGGGWRAILRGVLAVRQKRTFMRRALALRDRGMIVVCDRYPQNQSHGFNDGPLLASWLDSRSVLGRLAARYEARVYAELVRTAPDVVIRLKPSIDVAFERKSGETPREVLETKLAGLAALDFPESTATHTVDVDAPFDRVVLQVKRHVWRRVTR